ncbi:MAG: SDR family NAD(P)-dependent oxidoreductase [Hyphomicrobiaceae bacterium]
MNSLAGKVAMISGAARGIGAATARCMAEAGASVVIGDVLKEAGRAIVAEIIAAGGEAKFVQLDVRQERAWQEAVSVASESYGGLDILVNNAGIFLGMECEDVTDDDWDRIVAINLKGVYLGTRVCAPTLRARGKTSPHGSAIVNLASIAGLVGSQLDPVYSMTKGGVTLFTKSMALAFGRAGDRIRVNSVHPGVIETDMGRQTFVSRAAQATSNDIEEARERSIRLHPIGRLGTPEDIAQAIVFLASDDSGFMTGSALVVDGGLTAQ